MPPLYWLCVALLVLVLGFLLYAAVRVRNDAEENAKLVEENHQLRNFLTTARLLVSTFRDAQLGKDRPDAPSLSLAGAWLDQLDLHRSAHEAKRLAALAACLRPEDGRR